MTLTRDQTRAALLAFLLLIASVGSAETVPGSGGGDARLRSVIYDPQQIIRLQGYVGYQIDLEFALDERFANLAAGDTAALDVAAIDQHLLIKPRTALVGTNITIFTNRRVYHVQYRAARSIPIPPTHDVVYAVRFVYPMDVEAPAAAKSVDRELDAPSVSRPHNLQYDYCGPPTLRPLRVYDDGVQTHVTFPVRADIPAIFVRDAAGTESLANFHVESESVIIHQVAAQLVLRRGRLIGCLVNRGFEGGGEALNSRTLAPAVVRRVKEPTP